MTRKRFITILLWAITALWTALLFGFSGQNGQDSGRLSLQVTLFLMKIFPDLPLEMETLHHFVRKAAHFSVFAAEGMLLLASLARGLKRHAAIIALPVCLGIAALNEYHQSFTDGRHASIADVGIDFAGAACGILVLQLAMRLYRRKNANIP